MYQENPNHHPEQTDWSAVWNRQIRERRDFGRVVDSVNQWQSRDSACRYWENTLKNQQQRIKDQLGDIDFSDASRVLDIGAGPGILAIPLSGQVRHITAVEPMAGMVEVLSEKVAQYRIENVNWVQKYWEDIDIERDLKPPYDLVIASLSLNMLGIREAIQKMVRVSAGMVYLYWFAGEASWEAHSRQLIPRLYRTPFIPMPKSDILFNVLYQMGIYPNIRVFEYRFDEHFPSFQSLVDEFIRYYQAKETGQVETIRTYLQNLPETTLKPDGQTMVLHSASTCVKIWWEKNTHSFKP